MRNLELVTFATDAADATEVVSRSAARTPPSTRAGGQDDGSLANSLNLYIYYMLFISYVLYMEYMLCI